MAVSQQNLEGVVSAYAQARAKVMRVRAELERAEIDLAYTTIKAPISGRISASRITPGALVTASQESQLATILQTDQVYVDMMQSGLEYLRIKRERSKNRQACDRGKTLVRLVPQDGPVFSLPQKPDGMEWPEATGELLLSEDTVSPGTGCVLRRAIFPNPDGLLLPGMTVTAIVEEDTLKNALLVPQRAVMSDSGGRHHVFVLHEKNSQEQSFAVGRKDIELGTPVGHCWLVRAGLAAGDLVLVEGMQKTGPGETVRATRVLE